VLQLWRNQAGLGCSFSARKKEQAVMIATRSAAGFTGGLGPCHEFPAFQGCRAHLHISCNDICSIMSTHNPFVFCAFVVYQCFPAYLACYSALVFHSALVLSQCSFWCSCVPVGHYKWFLVQCNERSHNLKSRIMLQALSLGDYY
jgi:hypothetical protein